MNDQSHHSIGEVLTLLKKEHNDVTISKIRFFESQGLIDPERTPSGYRKFYDSDIDRLRWILTQQRDNFLPLKVIKRRLEDAGFDPAIELPPTTDGPTGEPTLFAKRDDAPVEPDLSVEEEPVEAPPDEPEPEPEPDPEIDIEDEAPPVVPEPGPVRQPVDDAPSVGEGDPLSVPTSSVSMTAGELAEAAGIDLGLLDDLDRLGLIASVDPEASGIYDHEALVVAKAAAVFSARGVEARHLRMFKVAAERESGILEQLVGAKLKRGGDSQRQARDELNELVQLGETIQRSILRRSFGTNLD